MGEEGPSCILKAAVVVATPFNGEIASMIMRQTVLGRFYNRHLGGTFLSGRGLLTAWPEASSLLFLATESMKKLARAHKELIKKQTDVDFERLQKTGFLYEFDREFQYVVFARLGPLVRHYAVWH